MAKTVQWAVATDDTVWRALLLRAAKEERTLGEVVEDVLRGALVAEIEEVSGQVPLAAMIQTVVRAGARAARGHSTAVPAGSSPTHGRAPG